MSKEPEVFGAGGPDDSAPAATLDDALGFTSQLRAELDAIDRENLSSDRVRRAYDTACVAVDTANQALERAIAQDDSEHPEEFDEAILHAEPEVLDPDDRNTPYYIIMEFTKPVTQEMLWSVVDGVNEEMSIEPPRNSIKEAHRATFDGFGHHVRVEPTIKDPK